MSNWGVTPRQSIERECARIGADAIVSKCIAILRDGRIDEKFLFVIGGPGARNVLDGRQGGVGGYWPRTWATRALLYAWNDVATTAVLNAARDESWRVREMAAKVVARHRVDDGLEAMLALATDPVARVRAAAARARRRLAESAS